MRRVFWLACVAAALAASSAAALPLLPGTAWGETAGELSAAVGALHQDPHDRFQTLEEGLAYLNRAQNGRVEPVTAADRTGVQQAYWAVSSGGPIKFYLLHGRLVAYKISYYQRSVFSSLVAQHGALAARLMYLTDGSVVWSASWRLPDAIMVWQRQLFDGYPFESVVYIWPWWFQQVSGRIAAGPPHQTPAHTASRALAAKK